MEWPWYGKTNQLMRHEFCKWPKTLVIILFARSLAAVSRPVSAYTSYGYGIRIHRFAFTNTVFMAQGATISRSDLIDLDLLHTERNANTTFNSMLRQARRVQLRL